MMTFFALLTKEMRSRLRRERAIWVIVVYICFMGLLGWLTINQYNSPFDYTSNTLSNAGNSLYMLLAELQLLLIIFITPAFTATTINGERERQTFDLLLCSRLSGFSMVGGKLLAGLANALLLVVASTPLFSLVFFFGGVSPLQVLQTLLIFAVTTIIVGTFGLFCSALFRRPAISTSVTYLACLVWLGLPFAIDTFVPSNQGNSFTISRTGLVQSNSTLLISAKSSPTTSDVALPLWLASSPLEALSEANPPSAKFGFSLTSLTNRFYKSGNNFIAFNPNASATITSLAGITLSPLNAYFVLCLGLSAAFFLVSMFIVKPKSVIRFLMRKKPHFEASDQSLAFEAPGPDGASAKA